MKRLLTTGLSVLLAVAGYAQAGEQIDTLTAAVVHTDKVRHTARTQTSLERLDTRSLNRGFAVLGTPDLLKTLQSLPGVSSGMELFNGFYVRGGDGSDNLFLVDGVPMYQVNHVLGLFSSFNTDMIDNVDFYKGGFPARYGGRLSSVVDVSFRDGSFTKWKGTAAIGLIDGRFQIEGPIVKDRTSLNFGIRRTWFDVAKALAAPFVKGKIDEDVMAASRYDFTDMNLKLVHLASDADKLTLSLYYGHDLSNAKMSLDNQDAEVDTGAGSTSTESDMNFRLKWGNAVASLRWDRRLLGTSWEMTSKAYYTNYTSNMSIASDMREKMTDEEGYVQRVEINLDETNFVRIHDAGLTSDWFYKGFDGHNIRLGACVATHISDPQRNYSLALKQNGIKVDGESNSSGLHYLGGEMGLYAEDEMQIGSWLTVNLGLRDNLYIVENKAYDYLEPRVALRAEVSPALSFKSSYAMMSQFTHQVSACYIDLPTNLWMPSTSIVKPMLSHQFVLGGTLVPLNGLSFDVEAFYKKMDNLYEYSGASTMLPQLDKWEQSYIRGEGRAYGMEVALDYETPKFLGSIYYTLSRSERFFKEFYWSWYPDRNDNLHKLTVSATYRFNKGFEAYASWNYHTGNRFTGVSASVWGDNGTDADIYDVPNSYHLPDYHRLDVGLNWTRQLRGGRTRTLNISIYNVYNRVNAMFGLIDYEEGRMFGSAVGVIPIIPTFSYSWRF